MTFAVSFTANPVLLFWWLLVGHALADYALQSDAMAQGKNRFRPIDPARVPPGQTPKPCWYYWLTAHALIHGGMVGLITGYAVLGVLESVLHWGIDYAKCAGWTDMDGDQALHAACKLLWVVVVCVCGT